MSSTNNENLKIVKNQSFYVNSALYTNAYISIAPEEETKFMENINLEALDKIIEEIEETEDNPNEWIHFDEAMDEIRRDILNE